MNVEPGLSGQRKERSRKSVRKLDEVPNPGTTHLLDLDSSSLRHRSRKAILSSIVTGEIGEDAIYPVSYFSSRLGVSATPIREALFDLAGDGLVEVVRNRGFRVPRLTDRDLDELYELRIMLEVPAVRRLAKPSIDLALAEPRDLAREMVLQAEQRQVAEFLWTDRTFHLKVLESLGNRQLVDLVAHLRDRTRLRGIADMATSGVLVETAKEHLQLLEALAAHDQRGSEAWMRHHLRHVRGSWAGRIE